MNHLKTYKGRITKLTENQVFVFGSNTEGRHGAGAAYYAVNYFGAIYGQAKGRQGQCYAIVTKDLTKSLHPSVSKKEIINQLIHFYEYAFTYPELEFLIAYSGSGSNLNGYTPQEMAEMFWVDGIPDNVVFEETFLELIKKSH